ncbi:hypothetical protein PLICRDRAFT_35990 [Plicaturopsis crispa FD-325 SS-3]|nr:hypothetical protein PLICRDRAFT_35990 [Plicaturopsis crispa FD-325 SS-3]
MTNTCRYRKRTRHVSSFPSTTIRRRLFQSAPSASGIQLDRRRSRRRLAATEDPGESPTRPLQASSGPGVVVSLCSICA